MRPQKESEKKMGDQWGDLLALRVLGESLADAKKARVSAVNRAERGGVLREMERDMITRPALAVEDEYAHRLVEEYAKVVPDNVRAWAEGIPGLGSGPLFPRIIAAIGHPRIATPYAWGEVNGKPAVVSAGDPFERSLRQLWQYCGCGDPETNPRQDIIGHSPTRDDKLRGGKRTTVRPLLHVFSSYLVRMHTRNEKVASSRYYAILEETKKEAAENRHVRQCQNKARPPMSPNGCGTFAHPEWGAPGSLWRPGHINMHAHRIVHKELLRDLWVVSGES